MKAAAPIGVVPVTSLYTLLVSSLTEARAQRLVVGRPITLGRSPECDVRVEDTSVSRIHARVELNERGVTIVDLGSRNGTRVRGERLTPHQPAKLGLGHVVECGDTLVVMRDARALKGAERTPLRTLVVGHGSRWFEPDQRGRTELGAHGPMARVLDRLVDERLARPGHPLSATALFEVGWPEERLFTRTYRASHVFGALSRLWRLGLDEIVLPVEGGFTIDPELRVLRVTEHEPAIEA